MEKVMKKAIILSAAVTFSAATIFAAALPQLRIDVNSTATKGGLKSLKSAKKGTICTYASWIKDPKKKKMYALFYRSNLKNKWEADEFEFVPEKDGNVTLYFRGIYSVDKKTKKRNHIYTAYDNIVVEGAELLNGDFEKLDKKGKPVGWSMGKAAKLIKKNDAKSGKNYAVACHDHPIYQKIKVKKDQKVTIKVNHKGVGSIPK
jgi:hypothetical protein